MRDAVFIHTNRKQLLGALVSRYSFERNSAARERFEVHLIRAEDHAFLAAHHGQRMSRKGGRQRWRSDDLQSFTPLRFMPPELMGYEGRALVTDPDVFAVGDVIQLLRRDMGGAAILCRRPRGKKAGRGGFASSVMLLDCSRLTHWSCAAQFEELFRFERDYEEWISLRLEPPGSIALFEDEWNDFDHLGPETKLLHNTNRNTQPWKTGLAVDFRRGPPPRLFPPRGWIRALRRALFGEYALQGRYQPHPDPRQEEYFFGLVRECLDEGVLEEKTLRGEIELGHLRRDAFEVLERTPPLAERWPAPAAAEGERPRAELGS